MLGIGDHIIRVIDNETDEVAQSLKVIEFQQKL